MQGAFPPLKNNSNIIDKTEYIAETIVKGKSGSVTVDGKIYNGMMPPMPYLTDDEILAVVNYVNTTINQGEKTLTQDILNKVK